ncbi:hypothetical protein PYW08_000606 [Mythimna loreyi]|uniref:Uncharacterized protein n=1 Tax=Mythimna loreyi TaxID=667449 RepID=A0ACC2RD66_9NEOP|nr:hypothetical protein PYW08_000606 [Mythimna loreyi]
MFDLIERKLSFRQLLRIDRDPEILKTFQCCVSGSENADKAPDDAYIKRDDDVIAVDDVEDRYLKSIFPKAEETLILDILANKENNVQKASEELIGMGFTKKETIVAKKKDKEKEKEATPLPQKKVVTIMKTTAEKNELKEKLQKKYSDIAERVITLALESVDYNEDRAEKILNGVLKEESAPKVVKVVVKETQRPSTAEPKKGVEAARQPSPAPAPPASRRIKTWTEHLKPILKSSSRTEPKFKSQYSSPTNGPNSSLRQGHKDSLLLPDYTPWKGPDPELRSAQPVKAEGPHPRERPVSNARGPTGLAKGPSGIAKGSLYQKLSKKSAKIIG